MILNLGRKKVKKAVLPVGGLGTRFLPATKSTAKEMLPVVDKPLIQYAIDEARAAGIEEFCFVTARGKDAIIDYFDIAFELEALLRERNKTQALETLKISSLEPGCMTAVRQQVPLGLGHAIWCARSFIGNDPFAVLLPDDLIVSDSEPCLSQLLNVFDETQGHVIAVETVPENRVDKYGIVHPGKVLHENRVRQVLDLVEKPSPDQAPSNQAIIGRYVLLPSVIEALSHQEKGSGGEIQLTDALRKCLAEDECFAVNFDGTRFDCGDKLGFLEAQIAVARNRADLGADFQKIINAYATN